MKARQKCTSEGRTGRFNLPVSRDSNLRRLFASLIAPPTRVHRYRNLSAELLEDTLEKLDGKRCT